MEIIDPLRSIFPLKYRVAVGLAIFLGLAIHDWWKFGRQSKRLREYGFVIAVIAATIVYAVLHDLITSTISPEYFTAGKGLASDHLTIRAIWLATLAAIGPGALLGVMLTFANNPSPTRSQLTYERLASYLTIPIACAIIGAVLFGFLGYFDVRNLGPELVGSIQETRRFITVWGIHWGTYTGGLVGLCIALVKIRKDRSAATLKKEAS